MSKRPEALPLGVARCGITADRPLGKIDNGKWKMENYGNRTRRLHNISFSLFNFPFAPLPPTGELKMVNGKWKMAEKRSADYTDFHKLLVQKSVKSVKSVDKGS
jgi:hypothetical protein